MLLCSAAVFFFYPERAEGEPVAIVLHHTKAACEDGPKRRLVGSTCVVYSWSAPRFSFERDRQAEAKYCDSKARTPNPDLTTGCAR